MIRTWIFPDCHLPLLRNFIFHRVTVVRVVLLVLLVLPDPLELLDLLALLERLVIVESL